MEPVCAICDCVLTKENCDCYTIGESKIWDIICKNCKEIKPRNRHEKRKQNALRR
jgi:hypothetical protein